MGKRRKRMTMARYAKKYALKRAALGFDARKVENKLIEIDMTSGEEISNEETVQVISNTVVEENTPETTPPWDPEPQLQTVQIEEPKVEVPPPVEAKKPARKRTSRRKTTTARRATTKKTED